MRSLVQLAKDSGYATLWNDEIATTGFGLFHYKAFSGFNRPPAKYYFRPYYEYLYQRLGAHTGCVNGQFAAPRYIDIWERFVSSHLNMPYFAFNFLTGLTHASANNIELYDNPLSEALIRLKSIGAFDNSIVLIMGIMDKELALFKIRITAGISREIQQFDFQYESSNFNFDVHKMLLEVLQSNGMESANQLVKDSPWARSRQPYPVSLFLPVISPALFLLWLQPYQRFVLSKKDSSSVSLLSLVSQTSSSSTSSPTRVDASRVSSFQST
uniref:Uncharacterized protein n=1 Tax=Ditylenchus dipsaci TaxID=166011 RepID=A0A915CWT8_9BILA